MACAELADRRIAAREFDLPQRYAAIGQGAQLDVAGPRQQLCRDARELVVYRYSTCFVRRHDVGAHPQERGFNYVYAAPAPILRELATALGAAPATADAGVTVARLTSGLRVRRTGPQHHPESHASGA